ncbi:MAG TPA: family 16 glycosylhydrolase [Acidobacteriaceae bacterium]
MILQNMRLQGTPTIPRSAFSRVCRSLSRVSLCAAALSFAVFTPSGCSGGGGGGTTGCTTCKTQQQAATPTITTANAQGGAEIVTLADTTPGATIYYTLDGSTPTNTSPIYEAPFLVASNLTVNAMAADSPAYTNSAVATQAFSPNIASGTLVWRDEFQNSGGSNALPSSTNWTYDTGFQCCGNSEQETYCAAGSSTSPCDPSNPNAYIAPGGGLNVVARNPSGTTYTSARLKSQGQFSFMYGRIEAKMKLPEAQGMWPAFWLLGNNIATINWPACGEADVMEHIDGNNTPFGGPGNGSLPGYDWIAGSVHGGTSGNEANAGNDYPPSLSAAGTDNFDATQWHTYGMIWSKGRIQYYVDDPSNIYATDSTTTPNFTGGVWPFDQGPMFVILNLAVGGDWPGNVDSTTTFPQTMQVQYVRIYTN